MFAYLIQIFSNMTHIRHIMSSRDDNIFLLIIVYIKNGVAIDLELILTAE